MKLRYLLPEPKWGISYCHGGKINDGANDQLLGELTQVEWLFSVDAGLLHSDLLIRQLDSWGYWVEGGGDEPTQKEVWAIAPKLGLSALRW